MSVDLEYLNNTNVHIESNQISIIEEQKNSIHLTESNNGIDLFGSGGSLKNMYNNNIRYLSLLSNESNIQSRIELENNNLNNIFSNIKNKLEVFKTNLDNKKNKINEIYKKQYDLISKNKDKNIISKCLYLKYKNNYNLFFSLNKYFSNITIKNCNICNKYLNNKKLISFFNDSLNSYNINYFICEKCFCKNIEYIESYKKEIFLKDSINSIKNIDNNNYNIKVKWGKINNEENYEKQFLYGYINNNFEFLVDFKILSEVPTLFYLEKKDSLSMVLIHNEEKKDTFNEKFRLKHLNKLYPGIYELYIFLKDKNGNESEKKYFKIKIICEKKKIKKKLFINMI